MKRGELVEVLLNKLVLQNRHWTEKGSVASYIPELARASSSHFGVFTMTGEGKNFHAGDFNELFTIQSVAKPLVLLLALLDNGVEAVFKKVGMEPTGKAFNSIDYLEGSTQKKPLNPMMNIGTITIYSLIRGKDNDEKFQRILKFTKELSGNHNLTYDQSVYLSEKSTGDRNRAMGYLLRNIGTIKENVEELVDIHFRVSSILVTCKDIARIGLVLANHGIDPDTGKRIIPKNLTQIVNTIMMTCGMYDGAGEFAVKVGLPAKSGVSGGIMCIVPNRMGIGVYAPSLDEKGNSLAGTKLLEALSTELSLSIF